MHKYRYQHVGSLITYSLIHWHTVDDNINALYVCKGQLNLIEF